MTQQNAKEIVEEIKKMLKNKRLSGHMFRRRLEKLLNEED